MRIKRRKFQTSTILKMKRTIWPFQLKSSACFSLCWLLYRWAIFLKSQDTSTCKRLVWRPWLECLQDLCSIGWASMKPWRKYRDISSTSSWLFCFHQLFSNLGTICKRRHSSEILELWWCSRFWAHLLLSLLVALCFIAWDSQGGLIRSQWRSHGSSEV